jgi:hypothetical protein
MNRDFGIKFLTQLWQQWRPLPLLGQWPKESFWPGLNLRPQRNWAWVCLDPNLERAQRFIGRNIRNKYVYTSR